MVLRDQHHGIMQLSRSFRRPETLQALDHISPQRVLDTVSFYQALLRLSDSVGIVLSRQASQPWDSGVAQDRVRKFISSLLVKFL